MRPELVEGADSSSRAQKGEYRENPPVLVG